MRPFLRKFGWILPVSLGLGLLLSLLDGGIFWIGWLAYSFMVTIGLVMVSTLWRSCGASRILGLILLMTVILRLGLGMAFSFILPPYGNDNEVIPRPGTWQVRQGRFGALLIDPPAVTNMAECYSLVDCFTVSLALIFTVPG
jgi:hypothetical protein